MFTVLPIELGLVGLLVEIFIYLYNILFPASMIPFVAESGSVFISLPFFKVVFLSFSFLLFLIREFYKIEFFLLYLIHTQLKWSDVVKFWMILVS